VSASITLADGATLGYADGGPRGDATPVLLLHAFPLHRGMWAPQVAELALVRRVVAMDLRGFGESTLGTERVTMDRHADDAAALLDHLGIARAAVVGLSMGGYVAFALARRHRERIAALVLADTRAAADGGEARAKRGELIALARTEGTAAVAEKQLTGLLGTTTREARPELVDAVRRILLAASPDAIVAATEALRDRPDSTPLLESLGDVPTLVLCGTEDTITRVPEVRAMAEAIPGSELRVIEKAGHLSSMEAPEVFNPLSMDFLDRNVR
jgi:3-oxoadipate enol-lactonase